jgi:hypothetical protein
MEMSARTPEQIMKDIEALPPVDLTQFCGALAVDLPRLTSGAFEVHPGDKMHLMRGLFRRIMRRQMSPVLPAGLEIVERVLANENEANRMVAEAVKLAWDYRADAAAARAKEERRRRRPTKLTATALARVDELVAEARQQGKRASWTHIAHRIHVELRKKYSPRSLSSMHYRRAASRLAGGR